jgi:hypothetical protein
MNQTLFNIILACIPIIGMVITGFIIPLIRTKLDTQKLSLIVKWVSYAVNAAEMIYKDQMKSGTAKKAFVIEFIDKLFNKKKVVITKEQISVLIENIVNEVNKDKQTVIV